jgi:hypothetical protein
MIAVAPPVVIVRDESLIDGETRLVPALDELEAEKEQLHARIAELEAELATARERLAEIAELESEMMAPA